MKLLQALPGLLLILLTLPTPNLKAQPAPAQTPTDAPPPQQGGQRITERDLQDYVNELGKELPMTIEKSIRWDSIALGRNKTLIYKYTFLDPRVQKFNPQQTTEIEQSVAEAMCSNEDVQILLDNDVNFNFKYHALQGQFLTEVFFNRRDCR